MAIITGKTTLAAGAISAWADTSGISNIMVGIRSKGGDYDVQFNLGSDIVYTHDSLGKINNTIVIIKANQVRVRNTSTKDIEYEVYG